MRVTSNGGVHAFAVNVLSAALLTGLIVVRMPAARAERASAGADKVTICHLPPGNPANAHTISVGASAVPAHLDHGDSIGACDNGGGGDRPTTGSSRF